MSDTRHTEMKCTACGRDCSQYHLLCDRADGQWCGRCFTKTPCGKGDHGEGCATQVFDDALSDSQEGGL